MLTIEQLAVILRVVNFSALSRETGIERHELQNALELSENTKHKTVIVLNDFFTGVLVNESADCEQLEISQGE